MKITACAYPADWAINDTVALPVFIDQIPPRGITGRIDFRLQGLISGLMLEQLINKDDPWLLISPDRKVAPELLLVPAGTWEALNLDRTAKWFQKAADKLFNAGAKKYALAIGDLYRPEFALRDFAGDLIRVLIQYPLENVRFYLDLDLGEKLLQELNRWLYHSKTETPIELELKSIPEVFEKKEK